MIKTLKYTDIFLRSIDFYPRYSDNIDIFQDFFLDDDLLRDSMHGLNMMMWQIYEVANEHKCNKDFFCMYDIDMKTLYDDFKKYIFDDDESYSFKKNIENGLLIYIDDYTKEFAEKWKNQKRHFKN